MHSSTKRATSWSGKLTATSHFTTITYLRSGTWADYTGEDVMGLKDSGIAAEFGLVSLTVPRRLWKPKKVAAAKQRSVRTSCL